LNTKHEFPEFDIGERNLYRNKLKENMLLCVCEKGGHHSFLEGAWPVYYSWLDKIMGEYLDAVHTLYESKEIK
jgi:predicted alpha/beta-fold hydrolase